MPTCETSTSTWIAAGSRHDSQLTTSSLRENSETNCTSSGNGAVDRRPGPRAAVATHAAEAEHAGNAQRAEGSHGQDRRPCARLDRQLIAQRRPERHQRPDQIRSQRRQRAADVAAPALADEQRSFAGPLHRLLEPLLQIDHGRLHAAGVPGDPGARELEPAGPEPHRHPRQALVPGHKPGDEHHRPAVALAADRASAHGHRSTATPRRSADPGGVSGIPSRGIDSVPTLIDESYSARVSPQLNAA